MEKKHKLLETLQAGDLYSINLLIASGVKVNAFLDENHMTPLHYCAKVGNLKLFRFLLSRNGSLKKRDRWMDTVLHYAVEHGNEQIVCEILKSKHKDSLLSAKGKHKSVPLSIATKAGNVAIIKTILKNINQPDQSSKMLFLSDIHALNEESQEEILQILIEKQSRTIVQEMCVYNECNKNGDKYKASINDIINKLTQDEKEVWLEHFAKTGCIATLKHLMDNPYGYTNKCMLKCLCHSFKHRQTNILELLLSKDIQFDEHVFCQCIEIGNVVLFKLLIDTASKSVTQPKQHSEISEDVTPCAKPLLDFDHIITMSLGKPCPNLIYTAMKNGSVEVVKFILDFGGKLWTISSKDHSRFYDINIYESPLLVAIQSGEPEILALVLKEGICCENERARKDLLHDIIGKQNEDMLKILLPSFPPDTLKEDTSIAEKAIGTGNISLVKTMIGFGLTLNNVPCDTDPVRYYSYRYNETPMSMAVKTGNMELVDLCCQAGVFLTRYGTEINTAIKHNYGEIVKRLIDYKGKEILDNILEDDFEWSPIHEVVAEEKENLLNHMIECQSLVDVIPAFLQKKTGISLLCRAIEQKSIAIVKTLLELGTCEQNETNLTSENDPLKYAIQSKHPELVAMLLQKRVPIHSKTLHSVCNIDDSTIWDKLFAAVNCDIRSLTYEGRSLFQTACLENNTALVKLLISYGISSMLDSCQGLTVLHIAIVNKDIDLLETCLQIPDVDINSNYVNNYYAQRHLCPQLTQLLLHYHSGTAVHYACEINSLESVLKLLEHGADINIANKDDALPLHVAVEKGNNELISLLCARGSHLNAVTKIIKGSYTDGTALHIAMKLHNIDAIKTLIGHGASVHTTNDQGQTSVFNLVQWKNPDLDLLYEIIQIFIDKGGLIKLTDDDGYTLLSRAIMNSNISLAQSLLKFAHIININLQIQEFAVKELIRRSDGELLQEIMKHGYTLPREMIKLKGIFEGYCIEDSKTCDIARIMINAGADINERDQRGMTLLQKCASKNYPCTTKLLLNHLCNIDVPVSKPQSHVSYGLRASNHLHSSALQIAMKKEHYAIVKLLIEAGAAFESYNILEQIVQYKRYSQYSETEEKKILINILTEIVRIVLEKSDGIDFNKLNEDGKTLLHIATEKSNEWFVQELLKHKCNVDVITKGCRKFASYTPLQIACAKGYVHIAQMLIEHEAILTSLTSSKMTLLHLLLQSSNDSPRFDFEYIFDYDSDASDDYFSEYDEYGDYMSESSYNSCNDLKFESNSMIETDIINVSEQLLQIGPGKAFFSATSEGWSLLHLAVKRDSLDIVKYLTSKNCSLDDTIYSTSTEYATCAALHIALRRGNMKIAKYLIEKGCSTSVLDSEKKTFLHYMTEMNSPRLTDTNNKEEWKEIIQMLILGGLSLNTRDKHGATPLLSAVMAKNIDMVEILLDAKSPVNTKLPKKHTKFPNCSALIIAAQQHMCNMVIKLINCGADVTSSDKESQTALHYLCKQHTSSKYYHSWENKQYCDKECFQVIHMLLAKGADVNIKNKHGHIALQEACLSGNFEAVKMLNHGNPKLTPGDINDLMESCIKNDGKYCDLIIKTILKLKPDEMPIPRKVLFSAIEKSDKNAVFLLLQYGANPNHMDCEGNSALHIACKRSHKSHILALLLLYDAQVNLQNNKEETALHLAASNRNTSAIHLLLDHGAKPDIQDNYGWTFFHFYASEDLPGNIDSVFHGEININCKTTKNKYGCSKGTTPLMLQLTRSNHNFEGVKLFIEKGADPNLKDENGQHSLLIAMRQNLELHILQYLLEHSADVNIQDDKGWTALHIAVKESSEQMAKCFVKYNCNVNLQIDSREALFAGQTPLHIATKKNDLSLVQLLLESGANIFVPDSVNKLPMDLCMDSKGNLNLHSLKLWHKMLKAGGKAKHIDATGCVENLATDEVLVDLLIQSGYKLVFGQVLFPDDKQRHIEKIVEMQQQPLTLMRMAANIVRTNVRPNAIYGVKSLPLPDRIKSFVTFDNVDINIQNIQSTSENEAMSILQRHFLAQMFMNQFVSPMDRLQMALNPFGFQQHYNPFGGFGELYQNDSDSDDDYYFYDSD